MSASANSSAIEESVLQPLQEFLDDSRQLVASCDKPDRAEFMQVARITGMGFVVLGLMGYAIKLIHIPINNLLVGGQ